MPSPDGAGIVASALLSRPDSTSGTAALWHLAVHPDHRRRGIGHRLLTQCLSVAAAGAR
ncbi:GNAT family N-acetyltransferase [Streptomyces sp. NPDC002285]